MGGWGWGVKRRRIHGRNSARVSPSRLDALFCVRVRTSLPFPPFSSPFLLPFLGIPAVVVRWSPDSLPLSLCCARPPLSLSLSHTHAHKPRKEEGCVCVWKRREREREKKGKATPPTTFPFQPWRRGLCRVCRHLQLCPRRCFPLPAPPKMYRRR